MAKPIRATPQLKGEEAKKFVKRMLEKGEEKITSQDVIRFEAIKNAIPLSC